MAQKSLPRQDLADHKHGPATHASQHGHHRNEEGTKAPSTRRACEGHHHHHGSSHDRTIDSSVSRVGSSNAEYTRSEEHTSELQSLLRISYAVFCLKKKNKPTTRTIP